MNVALVLWLLPDKVLKADWLDVLSGRIAPWLATSVFVAGYTWFSDRILIASRSTIFRVGQVVLFVPLLLLEVPLVTVSAEITPPNAQLWIDGERASRAHVQWRADNYLHEIRLLFKPHRFELKPPDYWEPHHLLPQEIELGWRDMFDALVGRRDFHWSIVWPVTVKAACQPERIITLSKNKDGFEPNYLSTWALEYRIWPVAPAPPYARLSGVDRGGSPAVEIPVPRSSFTVRLPAGEYRFMALHAQKVYEEVERTISTGVIDPSIEFKKCPEDE